MIDVQHLTKKFGDFTAVDDLSFQVSRGDVLGFLGPNGAGKSTTMKMIVGFLRPTTGRVLLDGIDMARDPIAGQKRLGYLPEGAPAWAEMTPRHFLHFITDIRGLDKIAARTARAQAIDLTELHGVLDQPIETLSKGYRRRVGLAQAILHAPDVLIMDEPTDGLDPNQKAHIRAAIKEMATDTAIIVSTHILEEVDAICTHAMIIDKGRLLGSGTPSQLAARSRYCGAVEVVVMRDAADAIIAALRAADNKVESVAQGAELRLYVFANRHTPQMAGADFLAQVQNCVAPHRAAVRALALQSGRLDDVFATLTRPQGA